MKPIRAGTNTTQPVTIEATRIGPGVIGATLKRRRMPASRSMVARMPAPKKPVPRMFRVSTRAKTGTGPMISPRPMRNASGKR